jgi:hypothetical protein
MSACHTKNFDIAIWGIESPYTVVARYGEQTGYGSFLHDALQSNWAETIQVLAQSHTPPSERFILNIGGLLFDELFQGGIRDLWVTARADMQNDHHLHLRLRLDLQSPAIAALPWETLADPRRRRTLAADRSIALVRTATDVDFVEQARSLQTRLPTKILIVAAEEPDSIDATAEIDRIRAILAPFIHDQIELEVLSGRIDIQCLRRRLQESRPDILHIISHGEADGLYLWKVDELALVSASQLAAALALTDSVKLVFLNACLAGQPDDSTPFASLAQRLLQTGIPAVIAMQFDVLDRAAADFAGFLYEALVSGPCPGAIDVAMSIARSGLYISDPDRIDYATPLLWLNAQDGIILDLNSASSVEEDGTVVGSADPSLRPDEPNAPPLLRLDIGEKDAWVDQLPASISRESGLHFDYAERKKQVENALALLRRDDENQQLGNRLDFRLVNERLEIFNEARRNISNILERLRRAEG